jgi:hypothetical protein
MPLARAAWPSHSTQKGGESRRLDSALSLGNFGNGFHPPAGQIGIKIRVANWFIQSDNKCR